MRFYLPLFMATLLAVPAQAQCTGAAAPLFHCTTGGGAKTLSVCLQGTVAVYRFGETGRMPDLTLARRVEDVGMKPWNGIGRTLWEEVSFSNGGTDYLVSYAVERMPEGPPPAGRVIVGQGDSELADIACDTGSLSAYDFYPLFEAKQAMGQSWCMETQSWGGC